MAMHFAVLGHDAAYLASRLDLLVAIDAWAGAAARFHLVVLKEQDAAHLRAAPLVLPSNRTSIHSISSLPADALSLHHFMTANTTSGPGAIPCWKLLVPFLPSLSAVDELIFLDSDMLLLDDPAHLWAHFGRFSSNHLLGLALNHDGITGLNSGVLLMKLDRMRGVQSDWARALRTGVRELRRKRGIRLGWLADQTFLSLLTAWEFGEVGRRPDKQLFTPDRAPLYDRSARASCPQGTPHVPKPTREPGAKSHSTLLC